jgi:GTPase SAR1 family protein
MILVGNKCDMATEKSSAISKKAQSLAQDTFKCLYVESSAKNNINVTKIFNSLVELISKEMQELKQLRDSLNAANSQSRRNSSISLVRRISVSTVAKKNEQSRRFSEPVVNDKINKKNKNGSGKESTNVLTPNSRRKQKICTIS